jgi:uncharacterized damage-inducible protein DinB
VSQELRTTYGWVREKREMLFKHCEGLPKEVFTKEVETWGWGSIRNLMVHACFCYRHWLSGFAFQEEHPKVVEGDYPDVASVRKAFGQIDEMVERFLEHFKDSLDVPLSRKVSWQEEPFSATPRKLFTHTVTHEYHHKGQIVSLSRQLGYPASDTDLL